jgi:hypothetical protein
MSRGIRRAIALLALAASSRSARADILTFVPVAPTAGQFLKISAEHEPACPVFDQLVERFDQGIAFTFYESCECPPGPYGIYEAAELLAPLHEGTVRASIRVQRVAGDVFCGPSELLAEAEIAVPPSPEFAVAVSPPQPTSATEVVLAVDSACPILWRAVRDGTNIFLFSGLSPVGAPCTSTPSYRQEVPLGILPADDYTVILLSEPLASVQVYQQRFTVAPQLSPQLVLGGRYALNAQWRIRGGTTGEGTAHPLTAESGAFWFFSPGNLELTVKVLDGCALNGHRWLMAAGLTDVRVDLTARDLQTGAQRSYRNPLGQPFAPILDTSAFACD